MYKNIGKAVEFVNATIREENFPMNSSGKDISCDIYCDIYFVTRYCYFFIKSRLTFI